MSGIMLTAYSGAILGPIAKVLGWIMNGIYVLVYNLTGVEDVTLSIILLTIVIYACLFPLTYKQQKFSRVSMLMQPEIKAVQDKYKNKKDQASMQAMQQETQLVYQKYGVSPTGSCIQMLIQMPILFALYRVFYNVPAYIETVRSNFDGVVENVQGTKDYASVIMDIKDHYNINSVNVDFAKASTDADKANLVVDVLYKLPAKGWDTLTDYFPNIGDEVAKLQDHMHSFNYFFGLNISDTPWNIIKTNFLTDHNYLLLILALLIPILSYLTQMLNIKLMPQATGSGNDAMAQQMKTMNMMMPLFSLFICFTVPVGLGIYWVASALCRSAQQIGLNKHFEKLDMDDLIQKNQEKARKKREKLGLSENQIRSAATMSTKKLDSSAKESTMTSAQRELELEKAASKKANAKEGSLASKANMVKEFNERNSRK